MDLTSVPCGEMKRIKLKYWPEINPTYKTHWYKYFMYASTKMYSVNKESPACVRTYSIRV